MRANDLFKTDTLIIVDDQGDQLVVKPDDELVEVTARYADGMGPDVLLYFDQSHIPQFKKLIELLEKACSHQKSMHINIAGCDERITVCEDCGQEL